MKKIFFNLFLICLLFSGSQYAFSQWSQNWKWSMGNPTGDDIRYIKMLTTTEWIGLGFNGGLIKTTNAGLNWTSRSDVSSYTGYNPPHIRDGWFFDSNNGFAVGDLASNGLISRTSNGGQTWSNFLIPSTTINAIHFLNNNTGYVVGNLGIGYKTTNGGLSWTVMTMGSINHIYDVFALDAGAIYAAGQGGKFFKSTDGGNFWSNSGTALTSGIYSVYFKNSDTGFVGGSPGAFQFTSNGGASWVLRPAPATQQILKEFQFNNPEILAVGDSRYIFRTTNYGLSWSSVDFTINAPPDNLTSEIYSIDKIGDIVVISGFNGLIYKSYDNGYSWAALTKSQHNNALLGIHATSLNGKIWVAGEPGPTSVLYSSNGGSTWITNFGGARYGHYRDVEFLNDNTGYICGESGTILRTSTGGLSWDSITNTSIYAANIIETVNNDVVFVGCNGSKLFKSTNSGLNFTQTSIGSINQQITDLSFIDQNTGWAIVEKEIKKTTDQGVTWTSQLVHQAALLRISMVNSGTGFACGWAGSLFKTTNGGTNWNQLASQIPNNLTGISFSNVNNGFVVSGGGLGVPGSAMKTTNGGVSWQIVNAGSNALYNVKAFHPDSAITVGLGNILKYIAPLTGFNLTLTLNFELTPDQDTITVELRNNAAPYNLIESQKGFGGQGVSQFIGFTNVSNGTLYYIAVKHRNAITTWSKNPVSFSGNSLNYNFTSAVSQAYGDNMKNISGLWSFYQGDINQDEIINLTDVLAVNNDANNYLSGNYILTDLNSDGFTDLTDFIATFNNNSAFVRAQKP